MAMVTTYRFLAVFLLGIATNLSAAERVVADSEQLARAVREATPGSTIVLLPGDFFVRRLDTTTAGSAALPIALQARLPGQSVIHATGTEAIAIHHPYWIIQDLTIKGSAQSEHALHISGAAHHVLIKNNRLIDFDAHIKVNGENGRFPDDGVIENNVIRNLEIRNTAEPVTSIDIVGADNWLVRGNYIADFGKKYGDQISYGVFMKGNSRAGMIEQNLIACAQNTHGGVRIGMSFGGGGTGKAYCKQMDCSVEHTNGIMRNNTVVNCSDTGIYLNNSRNTLIQNNTLLMTTGMDVRFPASTATIKHNVLTGAIRLREGGTASLADNVTFGTPLGMWLAAVYEKLQVNDHTSLYRFVAKGIALVQQTALGLGQTQTLQCFPGLPVNDLAPDQDTCKQLTEKGSRPSATLQAVFADSLLRNAD